VISSGNTPGSLSQYVCHDDHVLNGHQFRQCLMDGSWSGSSPKCISKTCCAIFFWLGKELVFQNMFPQLLTKLTTKSDENEMN